MLRPLKTLQERSKMPFGMYQGLSVSWVVRMDPEYLLHLYKRKQIRLSGRATTALLNSKKQLNVLKFQLTLPPQ